ncbi:MAG: hypothetical protein AAGB51_11760 [Planctomycetota bacterium]
MCMLGGSNGSKIGTAVTIGICLGLAALIVVFMLLDRRDPNGGEGLGPEVYLTLLGPVATIPALLSANNARSKRCGRDEPDSCE